MDGVIEIDKGFVAGKVRIIDGGKREVVYKKDVFDYDSREVVK